VDTTIAQLDQGGWVHLFGEGKVNQTKHYPVSDQGIARLPRFKWGTARVIMEVRHLPTVIPVWLSGFEDVMPEDRPFPRFLPRPGKALSVTFAPPMAPDDLGRVLNPWRDRSLQELNGVDASHRNAGTESPLAHESAEKIATRIALTDAIQREVEKVGYTVSGPLLGRIA